MSIWTSWSVRGAIFGLAYLLGSIPFGLIFVKLSGRGDVRTIGSGNIGTTNVLRTGSKVLAAATLVADMVKGALSVFIAQYAGLDGGAVVGAGLLAVLGHIFPVWLAFKGGKGVATVLGVYGALSPLLGGLVALTWLLVAKLFKISSLSALMALFMAPLFSFVIGDSTELILLGVGLYILICWTHRENIRRLLKGEESVICKSKTSKSKPEKR
jgi:acyl phosphate:glycerol-3-phosphate acyltransferase